MKWFRRAAENGHAQAQNYMGTIYYQGIGVTKSVKDAKYWWQKAADQGHEKAKEALRNVAKAEAEAKVKAEAEAKAKAQAEAKAKAEAEARAEEAARIKAYEEAFHNKTFTVNGVSFEMIAVKGGTFTMGATSEQGSEDYYREKPTHRVSLSDYYIGKFEVTQELWLAIMGSEPDFYGEGWIDRYGRGNNYPAYYISWENCQEFIKKLNTLTGQNFRLPTEAEWEYAARGGIKSKGYKYSGSNSIGEVARWDDAKDHEHFPVGSKKPNELGIYDMSGSVREWCQDWYGSYNSASQTNPTGPDTGSGRVFRGGSRASRPQACRVSFRDSNHPTKRDGFLGFRFVLVP